MPRKPAFFLLPLIALLFAPLGLAAQTSGKTYFVRPGGGADRTVANGLTDVDCSAATGPNCAFGNPALLAWPGTGYNISGPSWILGAGDTVVIHAGQYACGYAGSGFGDYGGAAVPGNPFGPCFPAVPPGTTWLGDGSGTTQIFGRYGANAIFEVNVPNVVISGLELTDHGQCSRVGTAPDCQTSPTAPLSDFAQNGIITGTGASNLTLTDLNCHGFTGRCVIGPLGGPVHVKNVHMAYNGGAGWDFDNGSHTPSINNASVDASGLIVEWNGCNEEYPIVHKNSALSCFDQGTGGYGDGIGTPDTPLNFTCDHCLFRYNTQDGFDLLHTHGSNIAVTNSQSYGNEGQQWKLGAMQMVLFQNNWTVHNCSRIAQPVDDGPAFPNLNTLCRAGGDGIAIDVMDGGTYTFLNNSYVGYGTTTLDIGCGAMPCTKANITHQNNLYIGYANPKDQQLPGVFYWETDTTKPAYFTANPLVASDHNIFFNMRTCPAEAGSSCADPKIAVEPAFTSETSLDAIDFHLAAGSPAKGAGTGGADIGVLFAGTPPPPPPPPPAPLTITTSSLPAGTQGAAYSVTLAASGGTAPYAWAATTLPAGISLSAAGMLSGTPTGSGTANVTFTVTDASSPQQLTAATLALAIAAPPPPPPPPPTPLVATAIPTVEWTTVGKEGDSVQVKAGMTLRYGQVAGISACDNTTAVAEGWLTKTFTSDATVALTNDAWGNDPAHCLAKVGQVQGATVPPSAPPPMLTPVPLSFTIQPPPVTAKIANKTTTVTPPPIRETCTPVLSGNTVTVNCVQAK